MKVDLTLDFIQGPLPLDEYNKPLHTNVLLVTTDMKLVAVGEQNTNGGTCDCCGGALPNYIGYINLENFAISIPGISQMVTHL